MTQFKAVEIFNALLETDISDKRYNKDKDLKEKDLETVKEFIRGVGDSINDLSIFNPVEIMKDLSKYGTRSIVDKVVDIAVGSLVASTMENINFDNVLEGRSNASIIKATFESEMRSIVEKSILSKELISIPEESERDRDVAMITNIYDIINKDIAFYKFTPQQLFITAEDYTLLNELSPKEMISYMETNCYITYDTNVAS